MPWNEHPARSGEREGIHDGTLETAAELGLQQLDIDVGTINSHRGFVLIIQECKHTIVFDLSNRIELMIVAASTGDRQSLKRFAENIDLIIGETNLFVQCIGHFSFNKSRCNCIYPDIYFRKMN